MMLLVTEFTTERGEAFTVLQLLKRLRSAIIQIDKILYGHQGRIETLEIDVEEIKNNIEDIKEQLLNIINRVDTLENKVDIVEETLINIESNITNIETILNNHGDDISTINNLVTNMASELNELQGIVNNIPIVQPSLLNGYIKIDGVDVPVFVGGAGGAGGGGAIIADYPQKTVGFTKGETLICEFDVPDYNDTISFYGWMQIYANDGYTLYILFKGYDENNDEYLLNTLATDANSATSIPYNHYQYSITLFKNGDGISHYKNERASSLSHYSSGIANGAFNMNELIDIPKIVKVKMYASISTDRPSYILYPFCVYLSKTIGDGDDENGGNGGTFKSNKKLLAYKQFGENDYNEYKNVFNYLVGDEITKTLGNSRLRYIFRYPCIYDATNNIPTVASLQITLGDSQLNFGELQLSKDAINKNFNIECEIIINKNETNGYNVRALMKVFTADPILWENDTLIKTLYSNEQGVVIVPQDSLKFNVMLQNGYLNIGWYQGNPSVPPVKSGLWYGVLETDLITNIIGSD